MLKSCCCLLFCLLLCAGAVAQHPDDEYYPYAEREERQPMLLPDSILFYRAVQSPDDSYGRYTDFNLPQVALKRRGFDYREERIVLAGAVMSYRYSSALRLLGAVENRYAGITPSPGLTGGAGGIRSFSFGDGEPLLPYFASVRFTDRNYLVGAKISATGTLGRGWRGVVAVDARTGRDMHIEGVFTNALTAGFRLAKRFGAGHELSLMFVVPPSVRGTRLSSTEEAFSLTGDRLYNPAWGFQHGKVRNSRVRREVVPLAVAGYRGGLSDATSLAVTFAAEAGVRKYSVLGWYNARTPMPDNYRKMPSYSGYPETEAAWRRQDVSFTQIEWDDLIAVNRMAASHAAFALEDRVGRICAVQADATFTTVIDRRLTLHYGAFYRLSDTRSYKQMRDLLGAQYVLNIDQYLWDDFSITNLMQNDLRHPDRKIGRGDRFEYDYSLVGREAGVQLHAEYRSDRFRADVALEVSDAAVYRCGHYEKEAFPGTQSYGRSPRMHFTPYIIKALAGWAFSPRSYLEFSAMAAASVPDAAELFYQPLYNNRTVDDPVPGRTYAAEVSYRLTGDVADLRFTAFAVATFDETQTRRYYDDLVHAYCDMALTGLGRLACGAEAAAELRLSYRWNLTLAASAGRYKYLRDPRVTVLSDTDNTAVDIRSVSHLGDCETGGAPQLTACAGVGYFGPKGWGFRLSAGYAGRRFVEPSPLRRTSRFAAQHGITAEAFADFVRQERLRDAFTLDASLFKSFYFGRSRLTAALMLRNLPGSRNTIYSGYESLRVRRIKAGDRGFWEPHASRYTYAYPRSFYLTISYRF